GDGRTLAFSGENAHSVTGAKLFFGGALYIRRLGEADAVPVSGADDAWQPAFSPDGSRIAYVRREERFHGHIETIALTGGRPTRASREGKAMKGIDWSDEGRIIYGTRDGLRSIPEGGGPVSDLTSRPEDGTVKMHAFPDALPGGRGIL